MLGTATGRNGHLWCSLGNPRNYSLSFPVPGVQPLINLCQPSMALIGTSPSQQDRSSCLAFTLLSNFPVCQLISLHWGQVTSRP